MKRDFLKALGLEDEAIEQIMKANGQDIAAEQAKIPSDYDQLKQQRDDLLNQISQAGSATDTGEPLQDDRMDRKLQELDDLKAQLQLSLIHILTVRRLPCHGRQGKCSSCRLWTGR